MRYSEWEVTMATILEQVSCGKISIELAAIKLKLSERTVYRKLKKYHQNGVSGLAHQNRGRKSHKKIPETTWARINALLEKELKGFGPTHAVEKLRMVYGINISDESLRKNMHANGFVVKKRRARSPYRSKRPRRLYFGELIQLDGSDHDWFSGRGPRCTLMAMIDDATSKIVALFFAEEETTFSVMEVFRKYIEQYGLPQALYTDRHSIYRITDKQAREAGATTQFQDACGKLGTQLIIAHSPQAKGRVERLFRFLQDRLVSEFSFLGVSSINEANKHMPELISLFNQTYEKKALLPGDANRSALAYNINEILTINEKRQLQNDWTFSYNAQRYQALNDHLNRLFPKEWITIRTYADKTMKFFKKEVEIKAVLIDKELLSQQVTNLLRNLRPKMRGYMPPDSPPLGFKHKPKMTNSCW